MLEKMGKIDNSRSVHSFPFKRTNGGFNFTCIPPCSRDAQFADLGAIPRIYVSSLLKFVPVAVNAVASDAICSKRLAGSAVGLKGKSFLLFLLSTKLPARLRFLRFSEEENNPRKTISDMTHVNIYPIGWYQTQISSSIRFLPRLEPFSESAGL